MFHSKTKNKLSLIIRAVQYSCFGKIAENNSLYMRCTLSIYVVHIKLRNPFNLQICPWIRTALRLKLKFVVLTQKMNHGTCGEPRSSEQLSQQAGGRAEARSGPVFTEEGGEDERERETDLKTFHRVFFKWSVSNHGSESNPCRENKLCYSTQKQRRSVIIKWLAWWVNAPDISSHSYTERSRLSLRWHLGSTIWNSPDWSRSRKLCLT